MNHWTDDDGPRGSGRSYNLIEQLPADGAIVVVPHKAAADWILREIAAQRGREYPCAAVIVNSMESLSRLRGSRKPIFIEHSWWDFAVKAKVVAALMEEVKITNSRFPDAFARTA